MGVLWFCAGLFLVGLKYLVLMVISFSSLGSHHVVGRARAQEETGRTVVASKRCWGLNAECFCPGAAISELLIRTGRLDGAGWEQP